MSEPRRSWWGWGWEHEALTDAQTAKLARSLSRRFDLELDAVPPPTLDPTTLRAPRCTLPDSLAHLADDTPHERARHTFGRAFRDVVRAVDGDLDGAPDAVLVPSDEGELAAVLDWCADTGVAVVPYGGGSSVVGGVEYRGEGGFGAWVSLDTTRMDRVLEIERTSRSARVQAGTLGPALEDQLRPHGLTFRHFPQSFEFSSVGGWLATRSGGHFATVYTHIDDLVSSIRAVTPQGVVESRRLPGSGAGPSPDRLLLGSEGSLGIITEAWLRLQDRPVHKASAAVHFDSFEAGVAATRAVAQSGLFPANCRLIDPVEAATSAGVTDGTSLLVLGFESADHPVDAWMARAAELCLDHGGRLPEGITTTSDRATEEPGPSAGRDGAVGTWRNAFLRAPYTRDALVRMGLVVETFETACTWDRFGDLHASVTAAAADAVERVCGAGWVTCRFTHVYPDGPAPYFSVFGLGRRGSQVAMWDEIKAAVSDALLAAGGTITHHHAVGRDHGPWYRRQVPEVFQGALRGAKASMDPVGILNPGVLLEA